MRTMQTTSGTRTRASDTPHAKIPCPSIATSLFAAFVIAIMLISLAAPAVLAADPVAEQTHVVQYGETLGAIALRYGVSVEALVDANDLSSPDRIYAGQELIIPEPEPEADTPTAAPDSLPADPSRVYHVVQQGETLLGIAIRYGLDMDEIASLNEIENVNRIKAGLKLLLPLDSTTLQVDALPVGPIVDAVVSPARPIQGQTVSIVVTTTHPISLTATFDGKDIPFVNEGSRQWALLGIHPTAATGFYPIELHAAPLMSPSSRPVTSTKSITSTTAADWEEAEVTLGLFVMPGDFETYNIELPPSSGKSHLLDRDTIQAEQAIVDEVASVRLAERLWGERFTFPLAEEYLRVTSTFGERRSYNGGPVSSYHEGIDYGASEGTPVYAAASGIIALAEPLLVRGNAVIISHGYGVFSGYWHLSKILVEAGDRVEAGDLIGEVGTTGLSTGSHLHWELRLNGTYVDPVEWVERRMP